MKTIILAGSTGLTGGLLLQSLIDDPEIGRVITLVRRPGQHPHPKVDERIVDFSRLSTLTLPQETIAVCCCLGTTIKKAGSQEKFRLVDHDYVVQLALCAARCQVPKFIVISAMGARSDSRIFYNSVKGDMEQAVLKSGVKNIAILRPSLIRGKRSERRFGEELATLLFRILDFFMVGPLRNYASIKAHNIARAMHLLSKQNTPQNRIFLSDEIKKIIDKL